MFLFWKLSWLWIAFPIKNSIKIFAFQYFNFSNTLHGFYGSKYTLPSFFLTISYFIFFNIYKLNFTVRYILIFIDKNYTKRKKKRRKSEILKLFFIEKYFFFRVIFFSFLVNWPQNFKIKVITNSSTWFYFHFCWIFNFKNIKKIDYSHKFKNHIYLNSYVIYICNILCNLRI